MSSKQLRKWTAAVLTGVFMLGGTAGADDILVEIEEAVKSYKAGDYSGAASGLDFAAQQIRQLQAGRVSEALPAPLKGWEAEDVETTAMGGAMFGGGISAARNYSKGNTNVEITILSDTPMLQGALMMINNPVMVTSSGQKLTRIKGKKAIVNFDNGNRSGEINVVVANSILITVRGSDATLEDVTAYAEAIDYDLVAKLAAGN